MNVRTATINDVGLILAFIHKKAEFDRQIGAFSGELQVNEEKIRQTMFRMHPFASVLFAQMDTREVGFALYGF